MKDWNELRVHGWMLNKFKLTGNDALVFAAVFGGLKNTTEDRPLSQSKYFANVLNIEESTVRSCLARLMMKGLVACKEELTISGNHYNNYFVTLTVVNAFAQATADKLHSKEDKKC